MNINNLIIISQPNNYKIANLLILKVVGLAKIINTNNSY